VRSPKKSRRGPIPPVPATVSRRGLFVAISIVLGGLTLALYAQVRGHAFLDFDDATYVVRNGAIRAGLTTASLFWAFTTSYAGNWHPLTWVSHMLDVQFHGMDAGWHHLSNLFIHVLTTIILFRVLARLTKSVGASAFVAALFALHPLHVESVAWVAERKDVLSGLWWVIAVGAYAAYARDQRLWRYGAVVVAFGLALLSKPMAVTLPFALLLLDIWPLARWRGVDGGVASAAALVREKIPLFLMAAASAVITFVAQRQAGAVQSFDAFPFLRRIANVPVAYVHYLFTTFCPVDLAVLYPYPPSIPIWQAGSAAALLVIVTAWALRSLGTRPYVIVGWLWFLGTLVPVIGIVQVGSQPYADRYMYIPAIGLFIIVAWEAARFTAARPVWRPWLAAIGALIVLASAAVTYRQIAYWKNDVTLWERDVAVTVDNYRGHTNLGFALAQAGSRERALAAYREALRLNPKSPKTHNYLGLLFADMGDHDRAAGEFEAALALLPQFAEARNNLGLTRLAQDRLDDAIIEFDRAVQMNPAFGEAHNNLGSASAQQGNLVRAIIEFEAAVRFQPGVAEPHANLAAALVDSGRPREALPHFETAIQLGGDPVRIHYAWAGALASLGDVTGAIAHLTTVLKTDPAHAEARQALRTLTGK
jgi:tetratricopeptide (TPR) repeat protein